MTHTLLKDGKLITVDFAEDKGMNLIAIKDLQTLRATKYHDACVRDEIYMMTWKDFSGSFINNPAHHVFNMTQSPWSDNSGLGNGIGVFLTKGDAIAAALSHGYRVFNNGVEITHP